MVRIRRVVNTLGERSQSLLSSRWNLKLFSVIFLAQTTLISFRVRPLNHIYDEWWHFRLIRFFQDKVLSNNFDLREQSQDFWSVGDVHTSVDRLYHLLLSLPTIALDKAGVTEAGIVLALRSLNSIMFLCGALMIMMALKSIGFPPHIVGLAAWGTLVFPASAITASTINYDNLAMLNFGALILVSARIFATRKINALSISLLVFLITVSPLIKINSAALVLAMILASFFLWVTMRKNIHFAISWTPMKKKEIWLPVSIVSASLGASIWWLGIVISNVFQYGSIRPRCDAVRPIEQCLNYPVFEAYYNLRRASEPAEQSIGGAIRYFFDVWVFAYSNSANWTVVPLGEFSGNANDLRGFFLLMLIPTIGFIIVSLAYRRFEINTLAFGSLIYLGILFSANYSLYSEVGVAAAHQFRYLLQIWLPLLAMAGMGIQKLITPRSLTYSLFWLLAPLVTIFIGLFFSNARAF